MSKHKSPLKGIPKRAIALRIFVYGVPINLGILGFVLDGWGKIATSP